ncbi:hypothetical protein [Flavobacterium algoritolerans]|uniref:hypothetical protein n=1 Tax=Flavobacterium algoritolerans TaxID=3041254 RepID=UPI0024A87502|nr:hypothetical protein [Flavobacterium algoritolerans]
MANNKYINKVCSNTQSDLIEITHDKLENILIKYLKEYRKTIEWMTPLGLFLSFLLTCLFADFKDFLGISKEIWSAIMYILMALSLFWTLYTICVALYFFKRTSIEYLINKIRND